jgi:23S rRNA pseudouridine2605 synthase
VKERLQKIMAQAGLGSRRACEELIATGRVTVNGQVAELGSKADPERDRILFDGQPLKSAEEFVYIAIYKPRGVLSTVSAPDPRPTVRDLVDAPGHIYPVGRLDVDSEGLVLLTNDGDLTNRLTHPRYGHEKEYRVLVARRPDDQQLAIWRRGVVLEDGYHTAPVELHTEQPSGKGMWLRLVMKEGRKRQIRETGTILGLPVVKIIRVRIGSLLLGSLKPRQWRYLKPEEVNDLKQGKKPSRGSKLPVRSSKQKVNQDLSKKTQKNAPGGKKHASGPQKGAENQSKKRVRRHS